MKFLDYVEKRRSYYALDNQVDITKEGNLVTNMVTASKVDQVAKNTDVMAHMAYKKWVQLKE